MIDLSPRAYRLCLAAVLLAAAAAGVIRLAMPPVWLDEASSWYNASGSWSHLWQRAVQGEDSGGLLDSILLKLWTTAAGTGEFALRLPGVVLWLAALALLARAVRLAWSRQAAVLAAAAALAHPSLLAAARQARSYILLLALTALVLAALAERFTGRSRRSAWLLAVASLAAAATHVMGIFVAIGAAACQAFLDRRRGRGAWRTALAVLLPALAFATTWTLLIRARVGRNLESFWIPGTIRSNYVAIGALLVVPLALACVWLLWRDRSPRARTVVGGLTALALPVVLGPAIVSAFAADGTHFVQLRYALPLAMLAAAAAGCALATLPRRLAAGLVALALFASGPYSAAKGVYAPVARGGQDIRGAAAFLGAAAKPGDTMLVEPPNNWMALAYYGIWSVPGEGRDGGWRTITENGNRNMENGERTMWLVRFSQRTAAPPGLLARAALAGRFGTLTILEVAPD